MTEILFHLLMAAPLAIDGERLTCAPCPPMSSACEYGYSFDGQSKNFVVSPISSHRVLKNYYWINKVQDVLRRCLLLGAI